MELDPESVRIGIIPGIDGAVELLLPLARELDPMQTVLLDGWSGCSSVEEVASHLIGRCRAERLAVLVGESFGGPVAVLLAKHLPELRAIVMVSSFTTPPLRVLSVVTRHESLCRLGATFIRTTIGSWLGAAVLLGWHRAWIRQIGKQVVRQIRNVPAKVLGRRLRSVHRFDVCSVVDALPPMLSIEARCDPLRWGASVTSSRAEVASVKVEGVHLLAETQPKLLARLITEFLERLPAPGPGSKEELM